MRDDYDGAFIIPYHFCKERDIRIVGKGYVTPCDYYDRSTKTEECGASPAPHLTRELRYKETEHDEEVS